MDSLVCKNSRTGLVRIFFRFEFSFLYYFFDFCVQCLKCVFFLSHYIFLSFYFVSLCCVVDF